MNFINRRNFRVLLVFGLAGVSYNGWQSGFLPSANAAPPQRTGDGSTRAKPFPPEGLSENDTHGKVPGNAERTVAQMHKLYQAMQTFRRLNGGVLPNSQTKPSLISDMIKHPKEYGIASMNDMFALLRNEDMKYADGRQHDPHPETTWPYFLPATRPDGTAKGERKPADKHDVLAYTDMYFHKNIRNFKNKPATTNPVGFYLVLWDDGQVQKIPYVDVRFVSPQSTGRGGFTQTFAFPGEAGVPSGTLSYTEYNKRINDLVSTMKM